MQLFPDPKILLSIGDVHITWYAVLILTGALIAYALSLRTLKKWGYDSEILENFFVPMLLIAIVGARLYYVIFEWEQYAADPIRIFRIWEGGLAIHGGLIAGVAFGLWYFHRMKVDGLRVMDAIFPNILIAQALGRWGNFMNQEAFGRVVSESYYNGWPSFIKDQMYIGGQYREPTFLYESLANLLGFALITFVYRKHGRRKRGDHQGRSRTQVRSRDARAGITGYSVNDGGIALHLDIRSHSGQLVHIFKAVLKNALRHDAGSLRQAQRYRDLRLHIRRETGIGKGFHVGMGQRSGRHNPHRVV